MQAAYTANDAEMEEVEEKVGFKWCHSRRMDECERKGIVKNTRRDYSAPLTD